MTVKVAVVGYGNMGKRHVQALKEMSDVHLLAIVEPMAHQMPVGPQWTQWFKSIEELLASYTPDAVIVASPTTDHYRSARLALEAGCSVLVEKPFTEGTFDATVLMHDVPRKPGQQLMVGLIELFNPAVTALHSYLQDTWNVIEPKMFVARRSGLPNYQPGSVAADLATHDIAVIDWLVGKWPFWIKGYEYEGSAAAVLTYSKGNKPARDVLGVVTADWLSPEKIRELRVVCRNGTFTLDYIKQTVEWHPIGFAPEMLEVKHAQPLDLELRYFIDHVVSGAADEMELAKAGLIAAQTVERIIRG